MLWLHTAPAPARAAAHRAATAMLAEAGTSVEQVVSCTVYLTDIRHREPVYRVLGQRLAGVYPVFTGLVVSALARPEWLVEVTVVAVRP